MGVGRCAYTARTDRHSVDSFVPGAMWISTFFPSQVMHHALSTASRFATVLLAQGVRPGDRIAFLLMNGVEYIEAYFGAAKIGGVMVPLNWRLVPDELEFILKDSGSRVLIFWNRKPGHRTTCSGPVVQ